MTCDCVLRFAVTATTSTTNTSPHSPLQYVIDSPSTERDGQDGGGVDSELRGGGGGAGDDSGGGVDSELRGGDGGAGDDYFRGLEKR